MRRKKRKFDVGGYLLVCGKKVPYSEFYYSYKGELRVPVADVLDACMPEWRRMSPEEVDKKLDEITEVERLNERPWRLFRLPDGSKFTKITICTRADAEKGLCEKIGDTYYSWVVFDKKSVKKVD